MYVWVARARGIPKLEGESPAGAGKQCIENSEPYIFLVFYHQTFLDQDHIISKTHETCEAVLTSTYKFTLHERT